ncbi:hypothetical protein [Cognatilysobacter bugurensis]|uniref:Uncharacterized protein n=1 Tax=Cognatilysobacter bugurensis TaxID=543356 RepID=A0A918T3I4_9GAMM|nr:hypothetical protein [Lysobacter bugurensis]GHA87425.1 hypothetical protein GCM10007067_26700 [Lysobacter bugurensis]
MKQILYLLLAAALVSTPYAIAGEEEPVRLDQILEEQRSIRGAIETHDSAYQHVSEYRRKRVFEAQDRLFYLAEGRADLGALPPDDRLDVFNQLKKIEALLSAGRESERTVCERVAIAGTRRYQTACMTEAERERRAESAKRAMLERAACTTAKCKAGG